MHLCCFAATASFHAAMPAALNAPNAYLLQSLQKLKAQGHRVLIYSQFLYMLDTLGWYAEAAGHGYLRLDGSVGEIAHGCCTQAVIMSKAAVHKIHYAGVHSSRLPSPVAVEGLANFTTHLPFAFTCPHPEQQARRSGSAASTPSMRTPTATSCSCCPPGRAGWASTLPQQTQWSSLTQVRRHG